MASANFVVCFCDDSTGERGIVGELVVVSLLGRCGKKFAKCCPSHINCRKKVASVPCCILQFERKEKKKGKKKRKRKKGVVEGSVLRKTCTLETAEPLLMVFARVAASQCYTTGD